MTVLLPHTLAPLEGAGLVAWLHACAGRLASLLPNRPTPSACLTNAGVATS